MAKRWRDIKNDSDDVVARFLEPNDVKGITSQDIIIGPNEAAVIIEQGKIEDVITQSKQKNFGTSLLKRFENIIFGSKDSRMLFVDTSPIDVTGKINNIATKDNVRQDGICMLRFQLDVNNAHKLLNLIKNKDKLTINNIREKISDEITANVFSPYIHKYNVDEFKGNTDVQDDIEEAAMVEMRKTFDMWGLNLINLSTKWHISKHEKVERQVKDAELDERKKDIRTEKAKGKINREYDVKSHLEQEQYNQRDQHMEHKQDLEWKNIKFERDKQKTGVDHQEEIKTRKKKGEITREEMEWEMDKKEMERALDWKDRMNKQKMEKEEHETKLEINKFQETELKEKEVEADVKKTKAQVEAEKAKHNLETYKEAEDRERKHQLNMTGQMSNLMNASKQDMPNTLVQGTDKTSTNIQDNQNPGKKDSCPNCGSNVDKNWQHCPDCGEEI